VRLDETELLLADVREGILPDVDDIAEILGLKDVNGLIRYYMNSFGSVPEYLNVLAAKQTKKKEQKATSE